MPALGDEPTTDFKLLRSDRKEPAAGSPTLRLLVVMPGCRSTDRPGERGSSTGEDDLRGGERCPEAGVRALSVNGR